MASTKIAQLEQRAAQADSIIALLTKQLSQLEAVNVAQQKNELRAENERLKKEVATLTQKLVQMENSQGVNQYYDFSKSTVASGSSVSSSATTIADTPAVAESKPESEPASKQPQQEKKPKKEKPKKVEEKKKVEEAPIDVGRLDFRVGEILSAEKHPDADSLYVEQINCGEDAPRTVVSGLVKFIPLEEMQKRKVVVLCNLKPVKMRGVTSHAMVMCASTPEKVEILSPPEGSVPGDLVEFEGYTRQPDEVLNPKKKIFETCAPDLKTNSNLVAVYKDKPFTVPGKGVVKAQTLAGVPVK